MEKKHQQLGMNAATASHRLVKDVLFSMVVKAGHACHRCGGVLTRETFSIEHKKPWLDSEDPVRLFFDLENIGFSHFSCNVGASRKTRSPLTQRERWAADKRRVYTKERRHQKWVQSGY